MTTFNPPPEHRSGLDQTSATSSRVRRYTWLQWACAVAFAVYVGTVLVLCLSSLRARLHGPLTAADARRALGDCEHRMHWRLSTRYPLGYILWRSSPDTLSPPFHLDRLDGFRVDDGGLGTVRIRKSDLDLPIPDIRASDGGLLLTRFAAHVPRRGGGEHLLLVLDSGGSLWSDVLSDDAEGVMYVTGLKSGWR